MEILTSEQQAQIPKIQKKWREIVFSTEPIARSKAERAVRLAYAALDEKLPQIVFCTSPQDAFQKLANSAYSTKGILLIRESSLKLRSCTILNYP